MPLYVRESGTQHAPAIVFLHGGGVSGWMWQPQVEQLSDFHCLVPDLAEHGQSLNEGRFSIRDSANQIADLIRTHVPGGKAHVVGLSLGAQVITQLLSSERRTVVDHAIISGTLVRPIPGAGMMGGVMKLYAPFKNMPFMIRANMKSLTVPDQYFEQFSEDTRRLTAHAFAHITAENMSFRLPSGLSAATCPVLIVVGEKEQRMMRQSAQDLVRAIPGAKACVASKVGHNWSLQAPDLFTRTVRAWITDQSLPSELLPLGT